MDNIVYAVSGDLYWDTASASFVDAPKETMDTVPLYNPDGSLAGTDYLAKTLRFYGYPLGELMTDEEKLIEAKTERAEVVSKIVVDVDGMKFDGDEVSQSRMTRAVLLAVAFGKDMDTTTTKWVLADDMVAYPTIRQLAQALMLAGEEQTRVWDEPYKEE